MKINTLSQNLTVATEMNKFREKNGLRSVNSDYPWYIPVLAILTYYTKPVTLYDIVDDLASVNINTSKTIYSNFKKVALGKERDPYRRNYAYKLPGMAKACGLKLGDKIVTIDCGNRVWEHDAYYLSNRKTARNVILSLWPNTNILFDYMDKKFGVR